MMNNKWGHTLWHYMGHGATYTLIKHTIRKLLKRAMIWFQNEMKTLKYNEVK